MLTNDLLRVQVTTKTQATAKKSKTASVQPEYLDVDSPEALQRAGELVALFEQHLGDAEANMRGALEESLGDLVGHGTDFVLWRGLAKRSEERRVGKECRAREAREEIKTKG